MASSLTNLLYHIVFSTKERIPLIHDDLEEPLYDYIGGILRGQRSILLEIGGMPDHVHLLVKLKADLAVAEAVRLVRQAGGGLRVGASAEGCWPGRPLGAIISAGVLGVPPGLNRLVVAA